MKGKEIETKIRKLGVTYVAEECGVETSALYKWFERGVSEPRLSQLRGLWPKVFGKNKKAGRKKVKVIMYK